jgi:GTP-binding protein
MKKLTNTRSSGADDALKLTPPLEMSLEQCLEFINGDELVEVTPKTIRMRKRILDSAERRRTSSRSKK